MDGGGFNPSLQMNWSGLLADHGPHRLHMAEIGIHSLWVTEDAGASEPDVSAALSDVAAAGIVVEAPSRRPRQGGSRGVQDLTMVIGASDADRQWRARADLYVHVGDHHLPNKVGLTVPLVGQYVAGVRNALQWAIGTRQARWPWATHGDVAAHARGCAASYEIADRVADMERYT